MRDFDKLIEATRDKKNRNITGNDGRYINIEEIYYTLNSILVEYAL